MPRAILIARSGGKFLFGVQDLAQQLSIHPLHDHVDLAAVVVGVHLHDAGMVELFADFLFAAKAVEKNRIAFHFRVGDFDGDGAAGAEIGAAKNGGHAAASDHAVDAVMIELFAGTDGKPRRACVGQKNSRCARFSAKQVRPPAVHAHAFDASNADQLHADIITAVPLIGNIDQSSVPPAPNPRHGRRRPPFPNR